MIGSSRRNEIRKFILGIEKNYDVQKWKHNDYYLWPVLRLTLYMNLVREPKELESTYFKIRFSYLKIVFKGFFEILSLLFYRHEVGAVYLSASTYSVLHKGYIFNRFFDPIMDSNESLGSLYLNYSENKIGVYKPERQLSISFLIKLFIGLSEFFCLYTSPNHYINKLCSILEKDGYKTNGIDKKLKKAVRDTDACYALFKLVFCILKPKKIWLLCYYSSEFLGALIAAHKLSIPTIDLQHGGQGEYHLAYSSWTNVPPEGFESLPNHFYTWDSLTANRINVWAQRNNKHSAECFGNPWVEGWKKGDFQQTNFNWPDRIILFTLQPDTDSLEDYLLEAVIKTKGVWNWWIRIHPRQKHEKEYIFSRLQQSQVMGLVNIVEASNLPLPEIFKHCSIHITKFSGSAIEAYQFGVPTILIDNLGCIAFSDYISSSDLMYYNLDKNSESLISTIIKLGHI